jgi:DNA helicase HerA-like ATPase
LSSNLVNDILIGRGDAPVYVQARYGNRHGLVAGATGTGKTVSLMVLAEGFSLLGVPVFMADGDGGVSLAAFSVVRDGSRSGAKRGRHHDSLPACECAA